MEKKRAHEREAISLPIEILDQPQFVKRSLVTKDISKTGAFILLNQTDCLPVGRVVSVRVSGAQWGETISTISARVVRVTDEGMGLQFLDFDVNW
ncbi:MAG: PilZ domain-containing protein [Sulfuricaulis sp.]